MFSQNVLLIQMMISKFVASIYSAICVIFQVEAFAGDIRYTKEDEIKILVATDVHVGANEDKNKMYLFCNV